MADLFEVSLSRGSVGRLRDEISEALSAPVADAAPYGDLTVDCTMDNHFDHRPYNGYRHSGR